MVTEVGSSPYALAFADYWSKGWHPLPLPAKKKSSPPDGYTGGPGADADKHQLIQWRFGETWKNKSGTHQAGNIAIRMPDGVIGIDVDAYDGKPGAETFAKAKLEFGDLPDTWRSSARPAPSGIRFYRVPKGLWARGKLEIDGKSGIDIVQRVFRYAVAPPSVHPDTGDTYTWFAPDGTPSHTPPHIDELPYLPEAWVRHLDKGERPQHGEQEYDEFFELLTDPHGQPCQEMHNTLYQHVNAMQPGDSRHDKLLAGHLSLLRKGEQGHKGLHTALQTYWERFREVAADRDDWTAEGEWERSLYGDQALGEVLSKPSKQRGCRCGREYDGLISPDSPNHPDNLASAEGKEGSLEVAASEADETASSWKPIDLTSVLDGTYVPPTASLLQRSDGKGLLYPSKVHWFMGEPESGKSWLGLIAATEQLGNGERVAYLDYESDAATIVHRLTMLGAKPEDIAESLDYYQPQSPVDHTNPLIKELVSKPYSLLVIDGVTDAVGTQGASITDNDEVASWMRTSPRFFARKTGAAVVCIDHVTKDKDGRGRWAIGAQAKLAGLDGVAFGVEPVQAVVPGREGLVVLKCFKDRYGGVRAIGGKWDVKDRSQEIARVSLNATVEGSMIVRIDLPAYEENDRGDEISSTQFAKCMSAISTYLEYKGSSASKNNIETEIKGFDNNIKRSALMALVQDGCVKRDESGRYVRYEFVRPYVLRSAGSGVVAEGGRNA